METGVAYLWGCLGGFFAAGFVYVLPVVAFVALSGDGRVSEGRLTAMGVLIVFLTGAAGMVTLIPDHVTRGQAISLGLASQTIVKGLISGAREAVPP